MARFTDEIDQLAENMEKAVTPEGADLVKATILQLGPEGLRKVFPTLEPAQQNLLKSVLADMAAVAKSHKEPIQDRDYTLEPVSNSTTEGDYEFNEDSKMPQDDRDEELVDEAKKRKQMEMRNQGGIPVEGWEGQVIKAEKEKGSEKEDDEYEMPKKEAIAEHKNLVNVLESPDHKDDKKEAEKQKKELQEMQKSADKDADDVLKKKAPKGVDPDKHERCVKEVKDQGHDVGSAHAICTSSMKKGLSDMEKSAAKANLKVMITRMQERGLNREDCVTKLSKSLNASVETVSAIWDAAETLRKSDLLAEKGNPEGSQVQPPEQMRKEVKGGVNDPEDPSVPKYKDKSAKAKGDAAPAGGKAHQTADEGQQPPKPLAKSARDSYWHEEEAVYLAKSNDPFAQRSVGQNKAYKVDEFIELEAASREQRLAKSTFDYLSDSEDVLVKAGKTGEGSRGGKIIGHTKKGGKPIYDSHDHPAHADFDALEHHAAARLNYELKTPEFPQNYTPDQRRKMHAHHVEQSERHIEAAGYKRKYEPGKSSLTAVGKHHIVETPRYSTDAQNAYLRDGGAAKESTRKKAEWASKKSPVHLTDLVSGHHQEIANDRINGAASAENIAFNREEAMKKSADDGQPSPSDVIAANQKKAAADAKAEMESLRQGKVDSKLQQIQEQSGPRVGPKLAKSFVNDLIASSVDMGMDQVERAISSIDARPSKDSKLVKSFDDSEMDSLFQEPDMWKSQK